MSIIEVLFRDYVGSLRVSAPSVAVINVRLQKAAPPDMNADEKKALKLVGQRAAEVGEVLAERDRLAPAKLRPLLFANIADWTSFSDALAAKARVSRGAANQAQEVYASLFPNGMDFAQADAETAWSEGYRLLERIQNEELSRTLEELLGPEFLAAVTESTEALGNAIGTGSADRTTPSSTGLSEALLRFGRSIGRYGRMLAANCDEEDEASVARFMRAVAPIDQHRAGMRGDRTDTTDPTSDAGQGTTTSTTTSNGSVPAPASATSHASTPAPAPATSTSNGAPAPLATSSSNGGSVAA